MPETLKVLITVKTYPLPSTKIDVFEHVCTAGVLEDGTWVRLFPIDYRYKPYWEWYKKYQWIEVQVEKNKHDKRQESYSPIPGTRIKVLSDPIDTKEKWGRRRQFVFAKGIHSQCELNSMSQFEKSLGIVKPREVLEFQVKEDDRDWKPAYKRLFQQDRLFGPQQKPLEKIPYKFSYKFLCQNPDCSSHTMMIEDWEVGELYRRMRDKFGDEAIATEKVRERFFDQMCGQSKDTHFFVGTVLGYDKWVILGVFWPPK